MITYFQAILLGLIQGVTELFPISSLGHSVLIANLFNWNSILADQAKSESFFLSFLVVLHVATATALLIFYRKIWIRIIAGFFRSLRARRIVDHDSKLAWLIIAATIPAGLTGLIFEHSLRTQFAKPLSAIVFIIINGCILLIGDHYIRTHRPRRAGKASADKSLDASAQATSATVTFGRAGIIGLAQTFALFAGISRSGVTMVSGLYSGLEQEDAARFSFLLATPLILAAGLIKLPDFFSNLDAGVRGQILAGGLVAGIAAYLTVRYLDKYFQTKTLRPFGIYCIVIGLLMLMLGLIRHHF
jgi:undecaprenyl-diphosphatase